MDVSRLLASVSLFGLIWNLLTCAACTFVFYLLIALGLFLFRGYTLLPGLFRLHFHAPPRSRRYPRGVNVTISTRFFGFVRSGFRGPFISLYTNTLHMKLYGSAVKRKKRYNPQRRRDYPFICLRNILYRIVAFWLRGLKITIKDLHIYRADRSWQLKASNFVFSGHVAGLFGYRYKLRTDLFTAKSVREPLSVAPVNTNALEVKLELQNRTKIDLIYLPRFITLLRPRRLAFLDDLKVKADLAKILLSSPTLVDASIVSLNFVFYPGYSKSLKRKLPPSAPDAKRKRIPGLIRYWDSFGTLTSFSMRVSLPVSHKTLRKYGLFIRAREINWKGCGAVGDHRQEPITNIVLAFREVVAGGSAVSTFERNDYKNLASNDASEETATREIVNKLIAARPEFVLWVSKANCTYNSNFRKRNSAYLDVKSTNVLASIEPYGLGMLLVRIQELAALYIDCEGKVGSNTPLNAMRSAGSSPSMSSLKDVRPLGLEGSATLIGAKVIWLCDSLADDGDTLAVILSAHKYSVPKFSQRGSSYNICSELSDAHLVHLSESNCSESVSCGLLRVALEKADRVQSSLSVKDLVLTWDADLHSTLCSMWLALIQLRDLLKASSQRNLRMGMRIQDGRKSTGYEILFAGDNLRLCSQFPDGPCSSVSLGHVSPMSLSDDICNFHDVIWSLQDTPFLYITDVRLENPIKTMRVDSPFLKITAAGVRGILKDNFWFGSLLQDWLLRMKACSKFVLRNITTQNGDSVSTDTKGGKSSESSKKEPLPDIDVDLTDVEFSFEDSHLGGWMTQVMPLMIDENKQRLLREKLLEEKLVYVSSKQGYAHLDRLRSQMQQMHSKIYIERIKTLKERKRKHEIAKGHIKGLETAPLAVISAAHISFRMVRNHKMRAGGKEESLRILESLDESRDSGRMRDPDAWVQLGFREVSGSARGLRLKFRDYPTAFISVDSMKVDKGLFGIAVQSTIAPFFAEAHVAIGRRRKVTVQKGISGSKLFVDVKVEIDTLQSCYNTAFVPVLTEFGRACARFTPDSKNPSPKMAWFDNLRHNTHGRMIIVAGAISGRLCGSNSPYTFTKHFVDVHAESVKFVASRLAPTADDPCPISWELKNWYIWPNLLRTSLQSEIFFEDVKVRLTPSPRTLSEDPLNHYTLPFPSKEEVLNMQPGVGDAHYNLIRLPEEIKMRGDSDNAFTTWHSPLMTQETLDTYKFFRTHSMVLEVNVFVRHTKVSNPGKDWTPHTAQLGRQFDLSRTVGTLDPHSLERWAPPGSSLCYSDGVTTLIKIITKLAKKSVFCKPVPRFRDRRRKAPPSYNIGMVVNKSVINVRVQDLGVMVYNNLEPGCGIFASLESGMLELVKERPYQPRDLKKIPRANLVKRRAELVNLHSSIRVPGLDLGADFTNTGFLCAVKQLILSDDQDNPSDLHESSPYDKSASVPTTSQQASAKMPRVMSSGFGTSVDSDISPFYTFSPSNSLQRGKPLDKFEYKLRLTVFDLKMVWSPIRRNALWTFHDTFREKKFTMKAPPSQEMNANMFLSPAMDTPDVNREPDIYEAFQIPNNVQNLVMELEKSATHKIKIADRRLQERVSSEKPHDSDPTQEVVYAIEEVQRSAPKFEMRIYHPQVIFGSPETDGWVFLTSEWANLGSVEKEVQKNMQTGGVKKWVESEKRVHLENSQLYTQWDDLSSFDFLGQWVPRDAAKLKEESLLPLARVTTRPIALDLMYIKSHSVKAENSDFDLDDDDQARPSMLYINIKDIKMLSTSSQLYTVMKVIRKVLMQRAPISMKINEELTHLRYNLQLRGGKVPTFELKERLRRLRNITKQLKYCEDTGQEELVASFLSLQKGAFRESRIRYQAKMAALMTYLRTEHREIDDNLYPTMYLSYSFDDSSWILRETSESRNPLVKLSLKDLVCRHVFYFGKGSSQEFTFKNVNVRNMMHDGYFPAILHPNTDICSTSSAKPASAKSYSGTQSDIKASDGSSVAFRWYATQIERVGGIPVYDLLTINIAPLNAAMTNRLFDAIKKFLFPKPHEEDTRTQSKFSKSYRSVRAQRAVRNRNATSDKTPFHARSKGDDLGEMEARGRSTMHFKYVYIGECQLTASYKMKENEAKGFLDFFDLAVESPSYMYSSKTWDWKGFFNEVKSDLLLTIAKRAAGRFAMLKLIPGYKGTRKTIKQTADMVGGMFDKRDASYSEQLVASSDEDQTALREDEGADGNLQLVSYFSVEDEENKNRWCGLLFGLDKPWTNSMPQSVGSSSGMSIRKDRSRWRRGFHTQAESESSGPSSTNRDHSFGRSAPVNRQTMKNSFTEADLLHRGALDDTENLSSDGQSADL